MDAHLMSRPPAYTNEFILCTWDNGSVKQGMYLSRLASMEDTIRDAKILWKIPDQYKIRFFMTQASGTWEIAPGSWTHVMENLDRITMTVRKVNISAQDITTPVHWLNMEVRRELQPEAGMEMRRKAGTEGHKAYQIDTGGIAATINAPLSHSSFVPQTRRESKAPTKRNSMTPAITNIARSILQSLGSSENKLTIKAPKNGQAERRTFLESNLRKGYRCDACIKHPKRSCCLPRGHPFAGRCEGCYKAFSKCRFDIARGKGTVKSIENHSRMIERRDDPGSGDEQGI